MYVDSSKSHKLSFIYKATILHRIDCMQLIILSDPKTCPRNTMKNSKSHSDLSFQTPSRPWVSVLLPFEAHPVNWAKSWPSETFLIYARLESRSSWHTGFVLATSEFSPSYHTTSSTRSQQSSIGRSWFRSSSAGWNFLSLGTARGVQNSPLVSAPTSGFSKLVIFVQNAEAFMEFFKSTHQRNFHLSPARTATRTGQPGIPDSLRAMALLYSASSSSNSNGKKQKYKSNTSKQKSKNS